MKIRFGPRGLWGLLIILVLGVVWTPISYSAGQKEESLTSQDLLRRHREAFGTAEARNQVQSRVCEGTGQVEVEPSGFGRLNGPMAYASQGSQQYLEMIFDYARYPGEVITFDGTAVHAAWVEPQKRSELGEFLFTYNQVMREGLLGGVLSTSWALFTQDPAQVKYRGLKKIKGKERHRLDYEVSEGGRDLRIELYFEPKTYRHVYSRYVLTVYTGVRSTVSLRDPGDDILAGEQKKELTLEEEFSNFRKVDGLDLPQRWHLRFTTESQGQRFGDRAFTWVWNLALKEITHNRPINPEIFAGRDTP